MKRVICILLLAALCCSLNGCGVLKVYGNYVSRSGNGLPSLLGRPYLEISGDGMAPVLEDGEIVFFKQVKDPSKLETGDIIAYWTVVNGDRVIDVSRIVEIYDGGGYLLFATKDDNQNSINPITVHESEILAVY